MAFVQPGKKRDRFDRDCLLLEFIHSLPAFNFWLSEHKRRPNMDRDRVRESRERRVSEKKKKVSTVCSSCQSIASYIHEESVTQSTWTDSTLSRQRCPQMHHTTHGVPVLRASPFDLYKRHGSPIDHSFPISPPFSFVSFSRSFSLLYIHITHTSSPVSLPSP